MKARIETTALDIVRATRDRELDLLGILGKRQTRPYVISFFEKKLNAEGRETQRKGRAKRMVRIKMEGWNRQDAIDRAALRLEDKLRDIGRGDLQNFVLFSVGENVGFNDLCHIKNPNYITGSKLRKKK